MIIGLTGKNASGKGAVAEILKEKGFCYYSLSDEIREEIRRRSAEGGEVTRQNLIKVGNELREKYGPGILAERVLARLSEDRNYVIDSIRNPAEVEVLRRRKDFTLVNVDASDQIRFERIRKRARESDPQTLEGFRELEELELYGEASHQQIQKCIEMADYVIVNEGSLSELREKVDQLLAKIGNRFPRPSWDDYFMNIARIVATRSNCVKRKVAAIIVKDNRIISTGYNGTPRGAKNCNEGGCPRCASFATSGTQLDECLCSHGEENAITQAAYWGISVKDATLYSTFAPCLLCTKMIINSGIREVVYNQDYPLNEAALRLLEEAGVKVRQHKV